MKQYYLYIINTTFNIIQNSIQFKFALKVQEYILNAFQHKDKTLGLYHPQKMYLLGLVFSKLLFLEYLFLLLKS